MRNIQVDESKPSTPVTEEALRDILNAAYSVVTGGTPPIFNADYDRELAVLIERLLEDN